MFFDHVKEARPDPIFGLKKEFLNDNREEKVFLSIGVFQTDELKSEMLSSVKEAIGEIGHKEINANYLPIDGDDTFLAEISKLVFGEKFYESNLDRIYGAQTIGGTSALRIGGENLYRDIGENIFLTNPTWDNHGSIFEKIGFNVFLISYFDLKNGVLDFDNLYNSIDHLPEKSILVLHPCCHNPTGVNPSKKQWQILSELIKKKKLLPFFDFAYQGFSDHVDDDAYVIRLFAENEHEMFVAYSCSKNFSLYQQRTGALFFLGKNKEVAIRVGSHIKKTIRVNYSNPPSFGKSIVVKILTTPKLKKQWVEDLKLVRERIINTREKLSEMLEKETSRDFKFIKEQKGMFSLLGLSKEQVYELKEKHAIYLPSSGRINIAGVGKKNIEYIVKSISKVL